MSFLKDKFLFIVGLSLLFLSTSAYGYNEEHYQRVLECSYNKIEGCDLRDINLRGANLEPQKILDPESEFFYTLRILELRGADLRGSDLGQTDPSGMILIGAKYDEDTIFPEGFNPEEHGMIFIEKECGWWIERIWGCSRQIL